MAKERAPINFGDVQNAIASGTFFEEGIYDCEFSAFTFYDFNGKAKKPVLCFFQELKDAAGNDKEQYWDLWGTDKETGDQLIEPVPSSAIKGRKGYYTQIRFTESSTREKLAGNAPFSKFMRHLESLKVFDMDSIQNDCSELVGKFNYGILVEKNKNAGQPREGGGEGPQREQYETVVITGIPSKKDAAKNKNKQEDEPPAKKGDRKKKDDGPEDIVKEFLEDKVCVKDNEDDGVPVMQTRMDLGEWLDKTKDLDADARKETMKCFHDSEQLATILKTLGWKLDRAEKPRFIMKSDD